MNWQPSATISTLKKRSQITQHIRHFFAQRNVMEVETPLLASSGVTDVHIDNIESQLSCAGIPDLTTYYLQTSPEYAMKRLLAAGSGCIFQICKSFRNDEAGKNHNPEFTMLEWYRVGFTLNNLIDEVDSLLHTILKTASAEKLTYQDAFKHHTSIDPINCTTQELHEFLIKHQHHDVASMGLNHVDLTQYIFTYWVEANIGKTRPCCIYNFPASQAALACLSPQNNQVAERFEFYYKGIELANGFHELTCPKEQLKRFNEDNRQRQQLNRPTKKVDHRLIAALNAGLPDCSGVALGIDRLLMLALKTEHIKDVLSFDITRS